MLALVRSVRGEALRSAASAVSGIAATTSTNVTQRSLACVAGRAAASGSPSCGMARLARLGQVSTGLTQQQQRARPVLGSLLLFPVGTARRVSHLARIPLGRLPQATTRQQHLARRRPSMLPAASHSVLLIRHASRVYRSSGGAAGGGAGGGGSGKSRVWFLARTLLFASGAYLWITLLVDYFLGPEVRLF